MMDFKDIVEKVNIPTSEFKADIIQEVLIKVKKCHKSENQNKVIWNQVSQILWQHIQIGFTQLEDQLLCATCFYTVLTLTDKHDYFLTQVSDIIKSELFSREKSKSQTSSQIICLMYGMFQSPFFQYKIENVSTISCVLKSTFSLLISMGYEYSQYTFLAFKTIKSFNKICGSEYERFIFNEENNIKLLNLVIHNWENPVTGVRDFLKDIFKTIITILDDDIYKLIVKEIDGFYWNKAKYLMLSTIIEADVSYSSAVGKIKSDNSYINGLMYSLHKPGLVSAGADLYYAILKKIFSQKEWCDIFLKDIVKILCGTSYKAIENFSNYWCLTTFKRFPDLMDIILCEMEVCDTEYKLCSVLHIMKQSNKLGILNKWNDDKNKKINCYISIGLEHPKPNIRLLAIDIVCNRHDKPLPNQIEYEFVLKFLNNNLNSDCTVLRLSMLNSLKCFLSQLHIGFLNYMKHCEEIDKEFLIHFCEKLQKLLIDSLNLNGNYQRKITCVKSINLVWNCFSSVSKKKQNNTTLMKFLKEQKYWLLSNEHLVLKLLSLLKDPSDDVRDNANTLLFNYYAKDVTPMLDHLTEDAFECMKSKFFYEINCGQSILKLITQILFQEKCIDVKYKSVEDIFYVGYNKLIIEVEKRDIMNSIKNGNQVHSLIGILHIVVEVVMLQKYKLKISPNTLETLLNALEEIANQFSWEQDSSTSSDFSKMNDMVQDIIIKSGYEDLNVNDETKISGLHQIVLNCLWLNVKASCDLATLLIHYEVDDILLCEKCLKIITHVLETSRHKGAIEAAGSALGQAIRYLTSLPDDSITSKLPYNLLTSKLKMLISENGKMSSITRRGAGLSIMVHRIVSGDMKKGKPLFHHFMNTLLEECNKIDGNAFRENITENYDLPQAIYIHFLTRIVTDSSLSSEVMFYSARLAELAFNNLTSTNWQIRNAALQLYGALIPRQIGQKKASGTDDETLATVACDELRTHSPELWKYIKEQLNKNRNCDLLSNSNLIPIFNLLANSAKRYNFTNDINEQKHLDEELLKSLFYLLGSPIYIVRRLTAKSIFNIFPFDRINSLLLNQEITSENMFHGCLMLLENCIKFYSQSSYNYLFDNLRIKFSNILKLSIHSYVCIEKFENLFPTQLMNSDELNSVFSELDNNAISPGIYIWANSRMKKYIHDSTWSEIINILQLILDRNDLENYRNDLISKIETENDTPKKEFLKIIHILLPVGRKLLDSLIWKIIYLISLKINLSEQPDCLSVLTNLNENNITYKQRYMIPFAARIYANAEVECNLPEIIFNLTDAEKDLDLRYIAALANNELAVAFNRMSDRNKTICIKTAIVLLQDEDEDIRNLNVRFYTCINNSRIFLQPYICLQCILEPIFLKSLFKESEIAISILYNDLSLILSQYINCKLDEYNPFAQNMKNIFFEPEVFKQLIEKIKM